MKQQATVHVTSNHQIQIGSKQFGLGYCHWCHRTWMRLLSRLAYGPSLWPNSFNQNALYKSKYSFGPIGSKAQFDIIERLFLLLILTINLFVGGHFFIISYRL